MSTMHTSPAIPGQATDKATEYAGGLVYAASLTNTLATVDDLGRSDVRRRDFLLTSQFVVGGLAGPSRDWLLASLDPNDPTRSGGASVPAVTSPGSGHRADVAEVDAIRNMFAVFQEMDVIQGGGDITRKAVAQYLTEHVLPLLRQQQPDPVRRALCEVAAEQTYLAGWMAFDGGQHGLAQRYLIQSLRLAEESGNRVLGSHVLAGLSDQATQLGHPDEGLRLARAGRHGLRDTRAPAPLTDLYALEARALAAMGDGPATAAAIGRAERTFDQVDAAEEPEWAKFIDEAYVSGEIANSLRDLGDGAEAERYARHSVETARRQNRGRRGAISQTVVATSHIQRGDIEASADAAHEALDIAGRVPASSRIVGALDDLRRRLLPYQREPRAREVLDRLDATASR